MLLNFPLKPFSKEKVQTEIGVILDVNYKWEIRKNSIYIKVSLSCSLSTAENVNIREYCLYTEN